VLSRARTLQKDDDGERVGLEDGEEGRVHVRVDLLRVLKAQQHVRRLRVVLAAAVAVDQGAEVTADRAAAPPCAVAAFPAGLPATPRRCVRCRLDAAEASGPPRQEPGQAKAVQERGAAQARGLGLLRLLLELLLALLLALLLELLLALLPALLPSCGSRVPGGAGEGAGQGRRERVEEDELFREAGGRGRHHGHGVRATGPAAAAAAAAHVALGGQGLKELRRDKVVDAVPRARTDGVAVSEDQLHRGQERLCKEATNARGRAHPPKNTS
jgi:hypothetical protein